MVNWKSATWLGRTGSRLDYGADSGRSLVRTLLQWMPYGSSLQVDLVS